MSTADTGAEQSNHLTCAACRVIDRADGIEDGHIWNPDHFSSPSRRDLFTLMRRVQDHTADSITSVAGSMRFVYIHVIWLFPSHIGRQPIGCILGVPKAKSPKPFYKHR